MISDEKIDHHSVKRLHSQDFDFFFIVEVSKVCFLSQNLECTHLKKMFANKLFTLLLCNCITK